MRKLEVYVREVRDFEDDNVFDEYSIEEKLEAEEIKYRDTDIYAAARDESVLYGTFYLKDGAEYVINSDYSVTFNGRALDTYRAQDLAEDNARKFGKFEIAA